MALDSSLAVDKYFSQIQAVSLASALLAVLVTPGLILGWLVGKPLAQMRQFCSRLKQGNYQERLFLPNEARDVDGEDAMISLMRDMNWMARQIEIREKNLRQAVDELSESRRRVSEQNDYLMKVNNELAVAHKSLQERTCELEQACRQMQVMAMTDPLTAIANRRCFFDTLQRQFATLVCNCRPISLLILDIDRFKAVNDKYGHEAGDKVLQEIAEIIQENTRNDDLAARIGGEEYALLLPDASSQQAAAIACRIQAAVAGRAFIVADDQRISLTISIGICTLKQFACLDRDKLYSYADRALYHAKHGGRNSISAYDPDVRSVSRVDCA